MGFHNFDHEQWANSSSPPTSLRACKGLSATSERSLHRRTRGCGRAAVHNNIVQNRHYCAPEKHTGSKSEHPDDEKAQLSVRAWKRMTPVYHRRCAARTTAIYRRGGITILVWYEMLGTIVRATRHRSACLPFYLITVYRPTLPEMLLNRLTRRAIWLKALPLRRVSP